MITYTNIIRHDDKPFEEYLKLGGYSHSWLKHEKNGVCAKMYITDNMKGGSLVDSILTEPHKADMKSEFYPACKSMAFKIKESFGDMIKVFEKQISYTAIVNYQGFSMPTTGRLDFGLKGHAVVDLKITTAKDCAALIKFMGYENQVWHYCKMYGVDKAYIMIYSIPLKRTEIFYFDCSGNDSVFWSEKVLKFGTYATEG